MKITETKVRIGDLVDKFHESGEVGVVGYHGKLDIRPAYQREFIYKSKEQSAVIDTVMKGFPLNVMYWSKAGDDTYEVLDGQQRTMSICRYVKGGFSVKNAFLGVGMSFTNLPVNMQKKFLDYELFVYICDGDYSEKLEWFKTINIRGLELKPQELRNAVYAGTWTKSAKIDFSKNNGGAKTKWGKYLEGAANRQEYLETALKWISDKEGCTIEDYMGKHQHDPTATALWNYFDSAMTWASRTFPVYRSEMKGVAWGLLYNKYGERTDLDPNALEEEIQQLLMAGELTNLKGVYEYLLSERTHNDERLLNFRGFSVADKRTAYEVQKHICPLCGKEFKFEDMRGDHIMPWSKGGKTTLDNLQMLCNNCNLRKSDTYVKAIDND